MQIQIGDIVVLKSCADVKMTVREIEDKNIICDWFNVDKNSSIASMQRDVFVEEQLAKLQD